MLVMVIAPGQKAVFKLGLVLEELNNQKAAGQDERQNQAKNRAIPLSPLGRPNSQSHRQRRGDEYDRVDRTHLDRKLLVRLVEHMRVQAAKDPVSDKQAAEHEHLGNEENPHPLLGGAKFVVSALEV